MEAKRIEWKHDQFGRYTIIDGWLRLSVSKNSRDGKFVCLMDGCTLPVGSRNPEMFDEESRACDYLVGAAITILERAKTNLHESLRF